MEIPNRFNCCIDGTYYKIGKFNYVFMWNNDHWQRSRKELADLTKKKVETNSNNQGNPNGNPAKKDNTNTDNAISAVKLYGSMSKNDLMAITGMGRNIITHALTGLTNKGRLIYTKKTNLYSLPFKGAAS